MGANAQIAVPVFTAGQTLTALQQTQINTGIPVFSNTTTRNAAFGSAGEKALAEGQFAYLEDTNTTQYYDGAAWQPVGATPGLSFISATAVTTSTTSINNCFTSAYQNYRVIFVPATATGVDQYLTLRLRASGTDATTNYTSNILSAAGVSVNPSFNPTGTDDFSIMQLNGTTATSASYVMDIFKPQESVFTTLLLTMYTNNAAANFLLQFVGGFHATASSYDGFTFSYAGSAVTGTLYVYGYAKA